jgi:3-oxoacyl-[acyl-carrier protein] reductase
MSRLLPLMRFPLRWNQRAADAVYSLHQPKLDTSDFGPTHLKASGDTAIVNISSIGAMRGAGSSIAYAASKGALNTLTVSMARALAPQVRVNALCPGGLLGSWTRKIMTEEQYQARVRQAEREFPLRRGIWPIDVARAALFLVTDAVVMTGECLRMDAGEHLGQNLIRN